MFNPVVRILIKLFELLGCIACVIAKNLTDQKARRVSLRNQKYSREWSLLNNVTWSREGNAFANITFGGFTLITFLLLISRCINAKSRPTLTEKIFITVGMLFFFAMGGLVYASIDQVPPDLQDNAIIIGTLSFAVAFIFLIDLADPMSRHISDHTQTDQVSPIAQSSTQTQPSSEHKELNIPNLRLDVTPTPSPEVNPVPPNGYYFSGDQVDFVQTRILPTAQQPVFAKVLMPEKMRPFKKIVAQPKRLSSSAQSSFAYNKSASVYEGTEPRSEATTYSRRDYYTSDDDNNIDRPVKTGFVAQAARMWDRRARKGGEELSTIV